MDSKGLIEEYFRKELRVPIYQRSYSWNYEDCDVLMDDLFNSSRHLDIPRISRHFFGSIITLIDQSTSKQDIVDGQQRIMTISLLLAAIRDCLIDGIVVSSDENLSSRIDELLKDRYDDSKVYLEPVEEDRPAYYGIIRRKEELDEGSLVITNYREFVDRVSDLPGDVCLDDFFTAITRLQVVVIRLTNDDDAQSIFESINSTGQELDEFDKIRNFVLMNHRHDFQNRIYREYWAKIVDNLPPDCNPSDFFTDCVVAYEQKEVYDTYREFKRLVLQRADPSNSEEQFESIMKGVLTCSKIYGGILDSNLDFISKEASKSMRYINFLDITVSYPFILRLLYEHRLDPEKITDYDVEQSLLSIENMLVRRQVCNKYSTGLNSYFSSLFQSASRVPSDLPFFERLNYVILSKSGSLAYIRDSDVKDAFDSMDLYRSKHTAASVVLSLVEDSNDDTEDVLSRISSTLTVEHIMPRNKTPVWREMIGPDYDEVHDRWLNKLGNLTLTAYNSNLGDLPFGEKLHHRYGYLSSTLHLNEFARTNPGVWDEEHISSRHRALVDKFLEVMPQLESSIRTDPGLESYSLEEDPELFLGLSIRGCFLKGYEIKGKAKEIFPKIARRLYEKDPRVIADKVDVSGTGITSSKVLTGTNDCVEIAPGIFVRNHYNNRNRIVMLSKMLSWYGISPSELVIYGRRSKGLEDFMDDDDSGKIIRTTLDSY